MKPVRVLIIEDSRVVREFLQHIISSDPRLEVAGAAATAEEGIRLVSRKKPDVVSMDIRLPGMNGFEATRRIMSECPTPIVVVSASVEAEDLNITMNALKAGALCVVEKPVGTSHADYEALAERLCTQLAIMSQVSVVRQRFNGSSAGGRRIGGSEIGGSDLRSPPLRHPLADSPTPGLRHGSGHHFVGMVASTGGPRALQQILSTLPGDFPVPIAVVQHITAGFHDGFVHWLDTSCSLAVETARHRQYPLPGHVYVAPPDCHLMVGEEGLRLSRHELVCSERPSGTVLLESLADTVGAAALGVILTGMGDDGAEGLACIRDSGGYTIAEDECTAVVYGMPGAAMKLGAVCESLSLTDIAPRLVQLAAQPQEVP